MSFPDEDGLTAVAYLSGQDAVVLTSIARGPLGGNIRNRVWLHDFRIDKTYQLSDDQYLGNYVAWME